MILGLKQLDTITETSNEKRPKRQAQTGPSFPHNQWSPGTPISYYFDGSLSNIKNAIT